MKRIYIILLPFLTAANFLFAQQGIKEKDKDLRPAPLDKVFDITDRAGGTHNASNIGLFFENRGKLYPRTLTQGPSGEFPINSGKQYIYRINPMVGIPGNVIQGRYTDDEEWEAVGGYHNKDSAKIAFSDNPSTWNKQLGWPVKDAQGNPLIISDQDSYCVYCDSNNRVANLGIEVAQTGYAFGVSFVKNIIFYKFQIINTSQNNYSNLYFNLYTDIDVGNVSGGVPEYADDKLDFNRDKQVVYFFDDGYSPEWPDGKTGYFGVAFLKTPKVNGQELGITDMHYNVYDDDYDIDSVQYGIMSSSTSLYNSSIGYKYFHLGNNSNLHFDDPATIPASGLDLVANVSSGPYNLNAGDTLTFITALVAGETLDEILSVTDQARSTVDADFNLPKPPSRPNLSGVAGDSKSILYWDDSAEKSKDAFSGEYDFEGYRVYRSNDNGLTWTKIADFDLVDGIGADKGIQYSFTDTTVLNGFDYWYSITSYDRGNSQIQSLECPVGNTLEAVNTISLTPRSSAIGRNAVSAEDVEHLGNGLSNYSLTVTPVDDESLTGNKYDVGFTYLAKHEIGDLLTKVTITVLDSSQTKPYKYGIKFITSSSFDIYNLTTGDTIGRTGTGYPPGGRTIAIQGSGLQVKLEDDPGTPAAQLPETGDLITINYSTYALKDGQDTVIYPRPCAFDQEQATSDGVIFRLQPPNLIKDVSRIGGTDNIDMKFSVTDEKLVTNDIYIISVIGNGTVPDSGGFINIIVKNSSLDTVLVVNSLFNSDTFEFKGIEGSVEFNPDDPPSAGNSFSVETIEPVLPGILDKYRFKIKGASVDQNLQSQEMNKIRVVPNPYLVSSLYEKEYGELRREPLRQIKFINLPSQCTIYIFTVSGDLVKTLYHNSIGGTESWDLRAEGRREIAPGVYIYVVQTKNSKYIERFAVIK